MNKQKTLTIIGVISLVAILAVGVLSITGAVIRVKDEPTKLTMVVYTKAEIDYFLSKINTRLDKLEGNNPPVGLTCSGKNVCARILKVTKISNSSSRSFSDDQISFSDLKDGTTYETTITSEGLGTVAVDGKVYNVRYSGANFVAESDRYVLVWGNNLVERKTFKDGYIVLGYNTTTTTCATKDVCARILKVTKISNSSSRSFSDDQISFSDLKDGTTYETTITSEGLGTVAVDGKVYNVRYSGANFVAESDRYLYLWNSSSSYPKASKDSYIVLNY